jgi:hypothetical protein
MMNNPGVLSVYGEGNRSAAVLKAHQPSGPFVPGGEGREGSLLLFAPRSLTGVLIDELSGGYGYSHLAVDLGEIDLPTGRRVMVEADMESGVHISFQDEYRERHFVRIPLAKAGATALVKVDPSAFCNAIRSRVGQAYDYEEAFTLGEMDDPNRQICSDMAAVCLPRWMQADLARQLRAGLINPLSAILHGSLEQDFHLFVSPNGFAEYFGAPRAGELDGPDQLYEPSLIECAPYARRHSPYGLLVLVVLGGMALGAMFFAFFKKKAAHGLS